MGKGKFLSFKRWRSKKKVPNAGINPFDALPVEVWTGILEKVDDFEDRWNCYNTCLGWRNILEPNVYIWGFDKILPDVVKYLDLDSVLACRQVCKTWCASIDNVAANNASVRPYDATQPKKASPPDIGSLFALPSWSLTSVAKVKWLLEELDSHPKERCPIVGRYLHMHHLTDEDAITDEKVEEHQDLSCDLIKGIGQHVYYYSLKYDTSQTTPLLLCQLLRRQLRHLSNLKMLRLEHSSALIIHWGHEEELQNVVAYFRHNPLPHLQNLETLELLSHSIPMLLLHQLIWIHGPQLKKLDVSLAKITPALFQRLTNLTELWTFVDFETDIRNLLLCPAPLQKLTIALGLGCNLLAEYLLEVIRHFPQLVELEIKFSPKGRLEDSNLKFVEDWDCTSVKSVLIEFEGVGTDRESIYEELSFNFLRCFPSVERIHIKHHVICPVLALFANSFDFSGLGGRRFRSEQNPRDLLDLKTYMHCGLLYSSNIWNMLQNLQSFKYQWFDHPSGSVEHFHSRSVYEGMKRRKIKFVKRARKAIGKVIIDAISLLM